MKITICGSMAFSREMIEAKKKLEGMGWKVALPEGVEDYINDPVWQKRASGWGTLEGAKKKIEKDLINKHYREVSTSDAILVINKDKNGIKNYIGGNSFLEMGFAYVLGKRIYVLNPLPEELPIFYQELVAMQPIVLDGDLTKIA